MVEKSEAAKVGSIKSQPKRAKISPEDIESRRQEHLRRVEGPAKTLRPTTK